MREVRLAMMDASQRLMVCSSSCVDMKKGWRVLRKSNKRTKRK